MVKKKKNKQTKTKKHKPCFSQFIKPTVKNVNHRCQISPQAKSNLLAALQNVSVTHRYDNTQSCFPTNRNHINKVVSRFSNIPIASPLNIADVPLQRY